MTAADRGSAVALTEDERRALGEALIPLLDDEHHGPLDWHPCRVCPRPDAPCACSGEPYAGPELTAAVEAILTARAHQAPSLAEVDHQLTAYLSAALDSEWRITQAAAVVREIRAAGGESDG